MTLHEITIEVTQRCPNRCIYCSSLSDATKTQYLDYETICRVVDDAKSLGAKSVSLSGGEPFLHSDIVKIAEYIKTNRRAAGLTQQEFALRSGLKVTILPSSVS